MSASSADRASPLAASAGLYSGPAAWAISTQANYALAGWACARDFPLVPLVAALSLALALAGGILSAREWRRAGLAPIGAEGGRPDRLLAGLGVMAAALFGIIILIHGAAGIVFSGCER